MAPKLYSDLISNMTLVAVPAFMSIKVKTPTQLLVHRQVLHLKKTFFVITVWYGALQGKWDVQLYCPSTQKTLKIYFTLKQLIKLQLMIQRGKREMLIRDDTASVKSIQSKVKGKILARSLSQTRGSIEGAKQVSEKSSAKVSPRKGAETGFKFNRGLLRSFDKSTGGFLDKDFTHEFSVSKTSNFFRGNQVGIRDDMTVSDVSIAQSGSLARTANTSLNRVTAPVVIDTKQASRIERMFNNPYLHHVLANR